jgi:hypothetical protein
MFESNESRRDFLKKTAYVTPFILTMNVSLAAAQAGSAAPVDQVQDFSAGGTDGDAPGWSAVYDGNNNGKHEGWYKDGYKWLDEREAHQARVLDRHHD